MPASENVRQLVKRFEANRESYRSGKYNETQLRREFLDPFFEALGWDIFNKGGYAETYKDVIHEDSLEIEDENKAPDYSFRIGGVPKFFVEAKKPAVNIESNIHPAFQLLPAPSPAQEFSSNTPPRTAALSLTLRCNIMKPHENEDLIKNFHKRFNKQDGTASMMLKKD